MKFLRTNLNRRRICQLLMGLVGIAASRGIFAAGRINALACNGVDDLAGLLSNERSARIIGERYLKMRPQEANTEVLMGYIFQGDDDGRAGGSNLQRAKWRSRLHIQISQDFSAGRTVNIDGWILAETECRVCALVACAG